MEQAAYVPAERWRENGAYLAGARRFDEGLFWEAHEVWEGVWNAARGRDEAQAVFVQGLIQLAAGRFKERTGSPDAARELAARGLAKVRAVLDATGAGYLGVGYMGVTAAMAAAAAEIGSAPPRLRLGL